MAQHFEAFLHEIAFFFERERGLEGPRICFIPTPVGTVLQRDPRKR
jgi:hypothetical protein